MPLNYRTIEAAIEAKAMGQNIAGISATVKGWMFILVDSYNLSADAGRMFHATMGQQHLETELGDAAAAREAEKILLWTKEACEAALHP